MYISDHNYRTLVSGTSGDDVISKSEGHYTTIDAGAGNDSIYNSYCNQTSLNGGEGNDTIQNHMGDSVTLIGGSGNDLLITNKSSTIDPGAGSDTIELANFYYGSVILFNAGASYNLVKNFKSNDTIKIADGLTYATSRAGNDVFVMYGSILRGGTALVLEGATDKALNIVGGIPSGIVNALNSYLLMEFGH